MLPRTIAELEQLQQADLVFGIAGGRTHWSVLLAVKPGQSVGKGRAFYHLDSMADGECCVPFRVMIISLLPALPRTLFVEDEEIWDYGLALPRRGPS